MGGRGWEGVGSGQEQDREGGRGGREGALARGEQTAKVVCLLEQSGHARQVDLCSILI